MLGCGWVLGDVCGWMDGWTVGRSVMNVDIYTHVHSPRPIRPTHHQIHHHHQHNIM